MKREGRLRAVVECAELECRRLLSSVANPVVLSTTPADTSAGTPLFDAAPQQDFSIDTLIVPAYSSRPGATRKIFLDFNGHHKIDNWGGWWIFGGNDVPDTPAYDIDGDPNSFSAQELTNIHEIWQGVAEKYSPFDVDVTTIQPSKINGASVVIGGDGKWLGRGGGVSVQGGWGEEGFTDANAGNIAWVWDGQGTQNDPAYVAEAASHEVGHTLGLYHVSKQPFDTYEYVDGYIMGQGENGMGRWTSTTLSETIPTERDGDNVNSKGSQDELATIVSGHGFGYRPDDVGNTTGTSTFIAESYLDGAYQASATGVIEQNSDLDMFSFSHNGGSLDIEVNNAPFRGMLDPQLVVLNSNGVIIATSNTNTGGGVSEHISFNNIDAGTYYIAVSGSGTYGDIGQYRLNVQSGQSTVSANDTLSTATVLGTFGNTDPSWVATGFGGTAIINDSLTPADQYDYFKLIAPANANKLFVQLSGLTTSASLAVYDDMNGDGIIQAGEILLATNPSLQVQAGTFIPTPGHAYYVRVARGLSAFSGNYQLHITTDAAPDTLPASLTQATFDPAPLRGGKTTYDSIDPSSSDTVDYFRVKAERDGLFTFYMTDWSNAGGSLQLDVGTDANGNGILDSGEIIASNPQYLQNIPVTQNQVLLVRVTAGVLKNYSLQAIADYATGGNTTGALAGAEDLTGQPAGIVYEYFDGSVDFYDTFKIAPQTGQMQARIDAIDLGADHLLQIIHDANNNGVVDSGEIVASGGVGTTLTYNVVPGGTYYLRAASQPLGEFPSVGNYKLTYNTAGSISGDTLTSPGNITVGPTQSALAGYLAFTPGNPDMTNTADYYRFTLNTRTRFDVSINGTPDMGVQVGQLSQDGTSFVRIGGVGAHTDGVVNSLSVNLDPGTYLIRAYLNVAEHEYNSTGGAYGLFFKTAAITDNSAPVVTASSYQYEIKPVGVSFTIDQDVAGSIDPSDVVIRNLATNATYPIGKIFYDPTTHQIGYTVAGNTLPDGNYGATLLAGSIRDASANPLAADYSFDFFVLAGDANRDRKVDVTDLGILATNWQKSPQTFSQGDFNYDGHVDVSDLGILATNWQKSLATPPVGSEASADGSASLAPAPLSAQGITPAAHKRPRADRERIAASVLV